MNHVRNHLVADQDDLTRFLDGLPDESVLDFDRLVPMPKILDRDFDPGIKLAAEIALGLIDFSDDLLVGTPQALVRRIHRNRAIMRLQDGPHVKDFDQDQRQEWLDMLVAYFETGYLGWYEWRMDNWGTCRRGYRFELISPHEIRFDTGNKAPHEVVRALARQVTGGLTHEWADEDIGRNVGRTISSDGLISDLSGTRAGFELAFELRPDTREFYQYDAETGAYVSLEDSE